MAEIRKYFQVQVEETNADEVFLAIKKMPGVVDIGEYWEE